MPNSYINKTMSPSAAEKAGRSRSVKTGEFFEWIGEDNIRERHAEEENYGLVATQSAAAALRKAANTFAAYGQRSTSLPGRAGRFETGTAKAVETFKRLRDGFSSSMARGNHVTAEQQEELDDDEEEDADDAVTSTTASDYEDEEDETSCSSSGAEGGRTSCARLSRRGRSTTTCGRDMGCCTSSVGRKGLSLYSPPSSGVRDCSLKILQGRTGYGQTDSADEYNQHVLREHYHQASESTPSSISCTKNISTEFVADMHHVSATLFGEGCGHFQRRAWTPSPSPKLLRTPEEAFLRRCAASTAQGIQMPSCLPTSRSPSISSSPGGGCGRLSLLVAGQKVKVPHELQQGSFDQDISRRVDFGGRSGLDGSARTTTSRGSPFASTKSLVALRAGFNQCGGSTSSSSRLSPGSRLVESSTSCRMQGRLEGSCSSLVDHEQDVLAARVVAESFFEVSPTGELRHQEAHPARKRRFASRSPSSLKMGNFRRKTNSPSPTPSTQFQTSNARIPPFGTTSCTSSTVLQSKNGKLMMSAGSSAASSCADSAARILRNARDALGDPSVPQVCGALLSMLPPALGATSAGGLSLATASAAGLATPIALAFCPNPLLMFGPEVEQAVQDCLPENWSMPAQQNGMLVVTFLQGSLALGRIFLGDIFGGAYALMLATLGYNSRHPGPQANTLKTYILITFINGTVGTVDFIQNMFLGNYPILSRSLPLAVNVAHLVQFAVPLISFSGAYIGWEYIKAQRAYMARYHYEQAKPPAVHPSLPWPPPALPPPKVLEHMAREMEAYHKRMAAITNSRGEIVLDADLQPGALRNIEEESEDEESSLSEDLVEEGIEELEASPRKAIMDGVASNTTIESRNAEDTANKSKNASTSALQLVKKTSSADPSSASPDAEQAGNQGVGTAPAEVTTTTTSTTTITITAATTTTLSTTVKNLEE
ncbi:unnamed protein product [Amoebophrya sp. A25]|nr:unnamed protein product [Amoebophrya sp. A25]|eukprot:GSA25T00019967001.1